MNTTFTSLVQKARPRDKECPVSIQHHKVSESSDRAGPIVAVTTCCQQAGGFVYSTVATPTGLR